MGLTFRSGQLIFCRGRLWFGPTCPGGCVPAAPTCLVVKRSDFTVCGGCADGGGCGVTPKWNGRLAYDGTQWASSLACTPAGRKLACTLTVSGGVYTLVVSCDTSVNVWTGTRTGSTPSGQYNRTSGCDTSPSVIVY